MPKPDMTGNPCHFNPDGMTVRALKDCSTALRTLFEMMDRGVEAENIWHSLEQTRESLLRKHGASPV